MSLSLTKLAKDWIPPALLRILRKILYTEAGIRFEGEYSSYEDADVNCAGYDAENILEKVLDATVRVKNGEAAFERDSVLFDKIQYSWPVTASLMYTAACNGGRLHVLDFGGSLGSSYFQNRKFLDSLSDVRWCVVEQKHYVDAGRKHIQDDRLLFYPSIQEAVGAYKPDVVLLSSVLQYLSDPYAVLQELMATKPDVVILDRTPFLNSSAPSFVRIQHTPSSIYSANYPCWFFDKDAVFAWFYEHNYCLLEQFNALDKLDALATWHGVIFKS